MVGTENIIAIKDTGLNENRLFQVRKCNKYFINQPERLYLRCTSNSSKEMDQNITDLSSSAYIAHGVGPLVPSHVSRSFFKGLP
jgi:hypothetical protein